MNPAAISEKESSATGHCSDVSDSGRVCNTPRSSVLFDGIPTLTGLDGNMWATQLLTLNTSTSSSTSDVLEHKWRASLKTILFLYE